ncbi:hypothetical protein NUW54_g12651 [Trametes sanguinea]|uniref:Uncharacterized protein n=1 Tax=Trametes sanguinea TaxID=158606 RepID=A0ACC1MVC5_9APHY|nr:hypothetical protein NUW54_g12651 [Trametes sanguinea]
MTAITRNLPWFVKDLGVSIVGEKCYTSIVENLDLADIECLKYSLSKGLGLGIVVGGSIMKVPQLLLIVSARSARGLSLTSYVLETLSYAITLAYSYRNEFPFSTYGENLFLTPAIAPHVIHGLIFCLLLLFASHTQIVLRQAASMPLTYWAAAWLLVERPKLGKWWVGWSVIWGAVSCILWAAFLPPA